MNKLVSRNLILSGSVIIILFLVLILRGKAPFGKNQSSFASIPKKEITKIELSGKDEKLVLTRKGGKWLVNGKYEARKNSIMFINGILTGIKIKSPLSYELFQKEITEKGIAPVWVKVFEGSKLLRRFCVYRTASNKFGNIMKMSEMSKPFIVYLPGFEGDIGSGFVLNELFWRPFIVFSLLPSEISSIKFENRDDPDSAFEISISESKYILSDTRNKLSGWDTARIRRYISYFAHIPFESWAFDMPEADIKKIENTTPHFIISVIKKDGTTIKLALWDRTGGGDEKDSDRLWGKTEDNNEIFIIRYFDIDPVIKKRSYFFTQ